MTVYPAAGDKLIGKIRRALGEVAGRPDIGSDGAAQAAGPVRADAEPAPAPARSDPPRPANQP